MLISAREEDAARQGKQLPRVPVEAVVLTAKDAECTEIVRALRDWQRKTRGQWSDCAVLYRTHSHRDQLAGELATQGIPFTIENMDVMDMPEARDLFACMGAVVSDADGASLFRVAALPKFANGPRSIDPEKLRAGIKAVPRDAGASAIALVLSQIEGGPAVLQSLRRTRDEIAAAGLRGRAAVDLIVRNFSLDANSRALKAVLEFISGWEQKAITETGRDQRASRLPGILSRGWWHHPFGVERRQCGEADDRSRCARVSSLHRSSFFAPIPILFRRRTRNRLSSSPGNCMIPPRSLRGMTKSSASRRSVACFMSP